MSDGLEKVVEALQRDVKELWTRVNELEKTSSTTCLTLKNIEKALDQLMAKVDLLAAGPGNRWNELVRGFIIAVLGLVAGYFFNKLIGK
ncbi:MAG: hypothetical protein GX660_02825 [Clostridiaceae bacterium]|jgi:hypothetical protein|nr:hypothetical protein [Clostridiaceae bacterium]